MLFKPTHRAGATIHHLMIQPSIVPLPPITWAMSVRSASRKNARGGDVFEAITHDDGTISILMADLSSKGELAKAQSATLCSAFTRAVEDKLRPAGILAALNRLKLESPSPESDVTCAAAFVATFDVGSRSMIYASAGHDLAMILRDRSHRHLPTTGPVIGVLAHPLFADRYEPLGADDLLVLVTDGVTECRHAQETASQFGTSGIVSAVASARTNGHRAAHDAIVRSLDAFGGGYYRDDATIAVLALR
jgi:phosphoserine phosphatase RsbU/P